MKHGNEKRPARRPRLEERNPLLASKVIEVAAATGNITKTAEIMHVSRPTVREILTRQPEAFFAAKKELATKALLRSEQCLDSVSEADLQSMSPFQRLVGAKMLGQMANEQLPQVPALGVTVNVALLDALSSLPDDA